MAEDKYQVEVWTDDGRKSTVEVNAKEAREYEEMSQKSGGNVNHVRVQRKK